jgi:hypothetical protein
MRVSSALMTASFLAGLLLIGSGSAMAQCVPCEDSGVACGKAAKLTLSRCKKECRINATSRAEKLACYARCRTARYTALGLCKDISGECSLDCSFSEDPICPDACGPSFRDCVEQMVSDGRECARGDDGCREVFTQERRVCNDLNDPNARQECLQIARSALGECLHDCADEAGSDIQECMSQLRECVVGCLPSCGETFPICGGVCPGDPNGPQDVCLLTPGATGCQCVPPELATCGDSFPECSGECPSGLECRSLGLACACIPTEIVFCGNASAPECDGACLPGMSCQEAFGECVCTQGDGEPCGELLGPPICAGQCPPEAPICIEVNEVCECRDIFDPPACGELTSLPICLGDCPPDYLCEDVDGECMCMPGPPPEPCGDAEAPRCDGICPEGEVCFTNFAGECRCWGSGLACGELFGPPVCAGRCPAEAPLCRERDDVCECMSEAQLPPCAESESPRCGGVCGDGEVCLTDLSGECSCRDIEEFACGEILGLPLCAGICPAEAPICRRDRDLGECVCTRLVESPCEEASAPLCGGECPQGEICVTNFRGECGCRDKDDFACGEIFGLPICAGICPPEAPICHREGGECICGP